jgi:small subunit ribosomal protein S6
MNLEPKHYELTFIIPGSLAEDQHPQVLTKIKALLEKNQAKITLEENLGRKKLAYPIKQLRHGFYYSLQFNLEASSLKEIEKELKHDSAVLRFLLINKHQITAKEIATQEHVKAKRITKKIAEQTKIEETEAESEKEKEREKTKKKKISLEDLDKKLDEILGDEFIK